VRAGVTTLEEVITVTNEYRGAARRTHSPPQPATPRHQPPPAAAPWPQQQRTIAKNPKELIFEWEGKDKNGKIVRGEMRAGGEAVVSASLRRQGILVTKVKKRRTSGGKSIKQKDIAIFTRQLATMMKAGVPLLQAFDIVARGSTNPRMTKLLNDIRSDVETGTSLSSAFRKHPLHFDALYCNLVEAGEAGGILEPCSTAWPSTRKRRWPSRARSSRR
jgi:type II secretory pathway component PulF